MLIFKSRFVSRRGKHPRGRGRLLRTQRATLEVYAPFSIRVHGGVNLRSFRFYHVGCRGAKAPEEVRAHPRVKQLPPADALWLGRSDSFCYVRQDTRLWDELHCGVLTTGALRGALGFAEASAVNALGFPAFMKSHGPVMHAQNQISQMRGVVQAYPADAALHYNAILASRLNAAGTAAAEAPDLHELVRPLDRLSAPEYLPRTGAIPGQPCGPGGWLEGTVAEPKAFTRARRGPRGRSRKLPGSSSKSGKGFGQQQQQQQQGQGERGVACGAGRGVHVSTESASGAPQGLLLDQAALGPSKPWPCEEEMCAHSKVAASRGVGAVRMCWGSIQEGATLLDLLEKAPSDLFARSIIYEVGLCCLESAPAEQHWSLPHGSLPPMGASPDALILHPVASPAAPAEDQDEGLAGGRPLDGWVMEVVEVKNRCPFGEARAGRGGPGGFVVSDRGPFTSVPPQYIPQLQMHMLCTGSSSSLLVSRSATRGSSVFRVPRDNAFIGTMLAVVSRFSTACAAAQQPLAPGLFSKWAEHHALLRHTRRVAKQSRLLCSLPAEPPSGRGITAEAFLDA